MTMGWIRERRGTESHHRVFNFPYFIICIEGTPKCSQIQYSLFISFLYFCLFICIAFGNNPRHFVLPFNGIICGSRSFTILGPFVELYTTREGAQWGVGGGEAMENHLSCDCYINYYILTGSVCENNIQPIRRGYQDNCQYQTILVIPSRPYLIYFRLIFFSISKQLEMFFVCGGGCEQS